MNIDTPSFSLTFSPSPTPSRFTPFDAKQSSPRARWKRLVKQVVKSLAAHSPPKIIDILDETRPGRPLPNLPPELWIMIIRYACLPGPDEVGIAVSSSTTTTRGGGAGGSSTVLGMGSGTSHGRETATFLDAPSYYVPASHPHYQHSTTATPSSHHHHHSSSSHQTHSAHHHASLNLTRTSSTNSSTTPPNSASLLVDHPLYTSPHRQTPAYKLYLRLMDQKRSFALVSKMWNAYAQPALYEWVWLSNKRQAKALALTLLCQVCAAGSSSSSSSSTSSVLNTTNHSGIFIKRLHIETTVLARCNPADIRTILDYAPRLVSFSDYSGMRRNLSEEALERDGGVSGMLRVLLGGSTASSLVSRGLSPPGTVTQQTKVKRRSWGSRMTAGDEGDTRGPLPLKRLTWTCYGDGADLVEVERVLVGRNMREGMNSMILKSPSSSSSYAALEYLELDFNTMAGGGSVARSKLLNDYYSNKGRVVLPHLQTLVLTLDQSALGRIARWELPKLSNLSIRSGGGGRGESVSTLGLGVGDGGFGQGWDNDDHDANGGWVGDGAAGVGTGLGGNDFGFVVASWGRRKEGWRERKRRRVHREGGYAPTFVNTTALRAASSSLYIGSERTTLVSSASSTGAGSKTEKRKKVNPKRTQNEARRMDRTGWELFFLAHGRKVRMLELDGGGGGNGDPGVSFLGDGVAFGGAFGGMAGAGNEGVGGVFSVFGTGERRWRDGEHIGLRENRENRQTRRDATAVQDSESESEDDEEAEEAYLDAEDALLAGGLPEILTGLRVFITNAGCASWDWTNPDWIAPHALLPNHTGVEIVGVRGLEGRMWGAWGEWVGHLRANPPPSPSPDPLDPYSSDESPFFMLFEQLSSLLQPETFPALKYIRDLSEGSDLMRRGEIGVERGWEAYPGAGKNSKPRRGSLRRSFSRLTIGTSSPTSTAATTPIQTGTVRMRERSGSESVSASSWARTTRTTLGRARSRSYAMFRRNSISSPSFSLRNGSGFNDGLEGVGVECPDTLEEEDHQHTMGLGLGMRTEIMSPAPATPTIAGFAPVVMTTTTTVEEDASEYPLGTSESGTESDNGARTSSFIIVGGRQQQQEQTFRLLQPPLPRPQSRTQTRSRSNTVTTVSSSRTGRSSVLLGGGSTHSSMTSQSNHSLVQQNNRGHADHTSSFDAGSAAEVTDSSSHSNAVTGGSPCSLEHPTLPTRIPPPQHARVVKFWQRLLERTKARGVWLEDWRGLNVTGRELEKWRRGYV